MGRLPSRQPCDRAPATEGTSEARAFFVLVVLSRQTRRLKWIKSILFEYACTEVSVVKTLQPFGRHLVMPITLDDLRRFTVAHSLFTPTTLKRALHKLGF